MELLPRFAGIPWIASHPIAYPALEVLHIVGIALLLGSLVLLELRVWGAVPELPRQPLARLALTVTLAGFMLAGASGLLMFAGNPNELLSNRSFLIKMLLLMAAGLNALCFHHPGQPAALRRRSAAPNRVVDGAWLGAIICGRWIAYV